MYSLFWKKEQNWPSSIGNVFLAQVVKNLSRNIFSVNIAECKLLTVSPVYTSISWQFMIKLFTDGTEYKV